MSLEDLIMLSRRQRIRLVVLLVVLALVAAWASLGFLNSGPPRHIVLASGPEFGLYHRYAQRYKALLTAEGVQVEERLTNGAVENLRLLLDPKSGVDIAFMQGGIATADVTGKVVMLATLYYEPLWLFYRGSIEINQLAQLSGKRLGAGVPGSGTRALVDQLARATDLTRGNTQLVGLGGDDALRALRAGELDGAFFVGGAGTPLLQQALRDPALTLIGWARADGYARQFPFLSKLILPTGAIDLSLNVPDHDIKLIGTKAMLVSRASLHPALINLLLDTARVIHADQGTFEEAGEFPSTSPVGLPVSPYADQHKRFGPSILYRYLPFWLAALVERAILIVVPLLVIIVPILNYVPQFLRYRVRSRIFRWYGELALLERDIAMRKGELPVEQWQRDLDRIEQAVRGIRIPIQYGSEAYTLREHIGLVRRAVAARANETLTRLISSPAG